MVERTVTMESYEELKKFHEDFNKALKNGDLSKMLDAMIATGEHAVKLQERSNTMTIKEQLEAWVGHRYSLQQLKRGLPDCKFTDPSSDEIDYTAGEDYKVFVSNKEGVGTLWYALTREGLMYITAIAWEGSGD